MALTDALELRFLKSALVEQFLMLLVRQVSHGPALVTLLLVTGHQRLETGHFIGQLLPGAFLALQQQRQFV